MKQHAGVVEEFDGFVGLGVVRDDDGSSRSFHCTQIADGTRSIAVGTRVVFDLAPGPLGRWEAVDVAAVVAPTP